MKIKVILPLLALLFLTGCIEFVRQTMSYRHDTATDTLYIFQDYQGIFGAKNASRLEADEVDQLASVMKGERTFFFNNWITEYNRAALEEELRKPKGEINENPEYEAAVRTLGQSALANIRVENVGFYTNKEGQLCGAQRVTIRQCSQVLAALNRILPHLVREQAAQPDKSEAEKRSLLRFTASGEPFIRFDGNQMVFRWPLTEADYREFNGSPHAKSIREAGGSVTYGDGVLILKLGEPKAKTVSFTLPFSTNSYVPNALAEAKGYGIKKAFDPRQAAAQFLTHRTGEK